MGLNRQRGAVIASGKECDSGNSRERNIDCGAEGTGRAAAQSAGRKIDSLYQSSCLRQRFSDCDGRGGSGADRAELTRRLCARNTGVGADGIEFFAWTGKSPGAFGCTMPMARLPRSAATARAAWRRGWRGTRTASRRRTGDCDRCGRARVPHECGARRRRIQRWM